ncbi:MAG: carbamoyltransferase HypF [Candidatus Acididesulfobacter guangdongensis]|uniref:acylphosphatase n=1 Tax=Acididesulfobacter guangdongensis TaxID=2597225 RepID=A0A519BFI7_ACIG2|nr:MAG: carbamoyltransferase HypF [Candidatus Acididesulfobacter guangdongensis]
MIKRVVINITGIVQGVGFRPFIYRLSQKYSINGYVINNISGVKIEAEADEKKLNDFINDIYVKKPSLAVIYDIDYIYEEPSGFNNFSILESTNGIDDAVNADTYEDRDKNKVAGSGVYLNLDMNHCNNESSCGTYLKPNIQKTVQRRKAAVSPDVATCDNCISELLNPADRRFLYPFINCTDCGPRFTITKKLPYDRANTTMNQFEMCNECQDEYADPSNRRFHAQPNACFNCGPEIGFIDKNGKQYYNDIFNKVATLIKKGGIVAVKGIGGFHIMCDAANENAVNRLRIIKNRPEKPFAVMFKNISEVLKYAEATEYEINLLNSKERPIVLLKYHGGLAKNINCTLTAIGAFLPYTPIQHIIFSIVNIPIIATSGNISDEPIISDDDEALLKLGSSVDGLLIHKRQIYRKCDDSVIKIVAVNNYGYGNNYNKNNNNNKNNNYNKNNNNNNYNNGNNYNNNNNDNNNSITDDKLNILNITVRRSRGFVPAAINVPCRLKRNIIAVGSNLKNTFAYGIKDDDKIILSPHIGDLTNINSYDYFCECIKETIKFYDLKPDAIVSDMHPGYESTKFAEGFAKKFGIAHIKLQHHKAHIISCMAENLLSLKQDILGISWDGTGYGEDRTIWGGEFFEGNYLNLEHIGNFKKFKLIGSEMAIKQPQRIFLSLIFEILGEKIIDMYGNNDNIKKAIIEEITGFASEEIRKLYHIWKNDINSPETSSVGRLFDAVACMCGFKGKITYEGEAAIYLENLALSSLEPVSEYSKYLSVSDSGETGEFLENEYTKNKKSGGYQDNYKYNYKKYNYNKYNYKYNYNIVYANDTLTDKINIKNTDTANFIIDWSPIILNIFDELIELKKKSNKNIFESYNNNNNTNTYRNGNNNSDSNGNSNNNNNADSNDSISNSNANLNTIAYKFINTLVSIIIDVSLPTKKKYICLSGGVFQNSMLTGKLYYELKKRGLSVFINQKVPINDGGISLGQAFYGGII